MRVLFIHNAYQHSGGEDSVVEAEIALLRSHGHAVETYFRSNDDVGSMSSLALARHTLWSPRTPHDLAELIDRFQPDVIHAHNTFPLISPSLYWAAARAGVPVVQTLHNFRLMCLNAFFLREGRVCEDCLGHLPWRAVAHKCYRGDGSASAVLAGMLTLHRGLGTYRNKVARYIALNDFSRNKFIEGGLPADRISIKPNFVDAPRSMEGERGGGLFIGRLSGEKGIVVLLDVLDRMSGSGVDVVGVGPEEARLRAHNGVRLHGWLEHSAVLERMRKASYLVMPSIGYEAFGMVVVEAFASSLPVIASRLGSMAEIVREGETGLLFEPGNAADLTRKMAWAEANPAALREMGANARREYEAKYTPEVNYRQLVTIYSDAIAAARSRASHL